MRFKIIFFLTCIFISVPAINANEKPLVLGIHPYKTPSKLIGAFSPLAKHISMAINRPVEIRISKDYQSHIDIIGKKKVDIGFLGPASYVKLVNTYGEKPILARLEFNGNPTFHGKIVVRKDSPLQKLSELKHKRFAFGDPNSTMSHLVPRFMLMDAGIKVSTELKHKFLGSHDNVALGVLVGDYDAGAVKEAVFYKYENRGLRVLATTPALSEHLFVTSGNMAPALHNKIKTVLLKLKESKHGMEVLKHIKPGVTAMRNAEDNDYDNLRHILDVLSKGVKW